MIFILFCKNWAIRGRKSPSWSNIGNHQLIRFQIMYLDTFTYQTAIHTKFKFTNSSPLTVIVLDFDTIDFSFLLSLFSRLKCVISHMLKLPECAEIAEFADFAEIVEGIIQSMKIHCHLTVRFKEKCSNFGVCTSLRE